MKCLRTSVALAASLAALSWSAVSSADDPHKKHTGTGSGTSSPTTDPMSDTNVSPPVGTDSSSPYDTSTSVEQEQQKLQQQQMQQQQMQQQPIQTTQPGQPYGNGSLPSVTTTTAADYEYSLASADTEVRSTRPNRPMLATGGVLFAASYGASVIVAAASDTDGDERLYIPVVGPWLDMAERECTIGECSSREDFNNVLLIGSGVAQGLGVGLAIASFLVPEKREVRVTKANGPAVAYKPEIKVTPISLRGGGGIGAAGTF